MFKGKQRKRTNVSIHCFVLFIFEVGWGLIRVYMICVLHIDKSCYNMYDFDFTIILLVQICYMPVFLMNFNLFAEGLLPPDVWKGHRDFVLKLFVNWSKITGIFHIYMLVHHGLHTTDYFFLYIPYFRGLELSIFSHFCTPIQWWMLHNT